MSKYDTSNLKKLDEAFKVIKLNKPLSKFKLESKKILLKPTRKVSKYIHQDLIDYTDEEITNFILDIIKNKKEI